MGLMSPEKVEAFTKEKFPEYSPEEKEILRQRYSPEQMAALEAGEAAIDPEDLTIQGRLRTDPYRMRYMEDFSGIRPIVDKRPKTKSPPNPHARFMTLDEFAEDTQKWAESFVPKDLNLEDMTDDQIDEQVAKHVPNSLEILKWWNERSAMTDDNLQTDTGLAPALPHKVPGVAGLYKTSVDPEDEGLDDDGVYEELKQLTGLTVREIKSMFVKPLVTRVVSNQTRLGKMRSFAVMAVAGNGDGWIGLGEAKSKELMVATERAKQVAIKNMRPIRRYENRTIYGNVEVKISGSIVQLFARPPGFGLRVSHRIFEMCRAAGIQDLAAKMPRSRNPMNTVKATYQALMNQPDPEEIAMGRGKKLVDVRKVYYGGSVY